MFMNLHFPLKKNSVLLKSMDKYLLRMYDHGVIEHYVSKYFLPRGNFHFSNYLSPFSSLPNKRTCTPYFILTKLPPCTLLFGTASLSIFLNF